jgi:hypothetical protein
MIAIVEDMTTVGGIFRFDRFKYKNKHEFVIIFFTCVGLWYRKTGIVVRASGVGCWLKDPSKTRKKFGTLFVRLANPAIVLFWQRGTDMNNFCFAFNDQFCRFNLCPTWEYTRMYARI